MHITVTYLITVPKKFDDFWAENRTFETSRFLKYISNEMFYILIRVLKVLYDHTYILSTENFKNRDSNFFFNKRLSKLL